MPKAVFTSILAPHRKVTEEQLETEAGILALERNLLAVNRRRFLTSLAAASAIATVGGALSGAKAEAQTTQPAVPSVVDVLNFSLNFEFLEAEFYTYGSTGKAFGTVPVMNPPQVTLSGNELAVATALAQDERNHINLLQTTITQLGGSVVTEPTIDFSAGGVIPPVTTDIAFFAAARQFTALGNSAYAGAAQFLENDTAILTTAAQILGAEAQHMGVTNYLCALLGIPPSTTPSAGDYQIDAQDVPPNGFSSIFTVTPIGTVPYAASAPPPAVGIIRTVQQVLGVAYGVSKPTTTTPQAGVTSGGFFPKGVSGGIAST